MLLFETANRSIDSAFNFHPTHS